MADSQTKPLWMSGTPADDDLMVLAVSKRIRAFRKKIDKIQKIEASLDQDGKILTDDQKQLLASKTSIFAILQELEKLRETQIRIVMESNENEPNGAPEEREESREDHELGEETVEIETETITMEDEPMEVEPKGVLTAPAPQAIASRDLLSLFFTARLLDMKLQPHIGTFQNKIKENDRLAMQYLTVLVEGSGRAFATESNLAQRIDECELHAEKYLSRSEDEFMPGCSYNYIHKLVDQFVASNPARSPASINFLVPSMVDDSSPSDFTKL